MKTGAFSSAGTASKIATIPVIPKIAASKADFIRVNSQKLIGLIALYQCFRNLVFFPLNPFYGNCEAKFSKNFKRNSGRAIRVSRSRYQRHEKKLLILI